MNPSREIKEEDVISEVYKWKLSYRKWLCVLFGYGEIWNSSRIYRQSYWWLYGEDLFKSVIPIWYLNFWKYKIIVIKGIIIALKALKENGYDINFASSDRADGGVVMRGNDFNDSFSWCYGYWFINW